MNHQPLPRIDIFSIAPIQDAIFGNGVFKASELALLRLVSRTWTAMVLPYWLRVAKVGDWGKDFMAANCSWIRYLHVNTISPVQSLVELGTNRLTTVAIDHDAAKQRISTLGKGISTLLRQNVGQGLKEFIYYRNFGKRSTVPFSILAHGLDGYSKSLTTLCLDRVHFEGETLKRILEQANDLEFLQLESCRYKPGILLNLGYLYNLQHISWHQVLCNSRYKDSNLHPLEILAQQARKTLTTLHFTDNSTTTTWALLHRVLAQSTGSKISNLKVDFHDHYSHAAWNLCQLGSVLTIASPLTTLVISNVYMSSEDMSGLVRYHKDTLTSFRIMWNVKMNREIWDFRDILSQLVNLRTFIMYGCQNSNLHSTKQSCKQIAIKEEQRWALNGASLPRLKHFELQQDFIWSSRSTKRRWTVISFPKLCEYMLPFISRMVNLKTLKLDLVISQLPQTDNWKIELLESWKLLRRCTKLKVLTIEWDLNEAHAELLEWSRQHWSSQLDISLKKRY